MEPAKIDWKTIESVFVEDSLYEHINAPKWVDFSAPPEQDKNQDETWFCRPDCKHPKTVEDFYKLSPPSKLLSMVGISDMLQLRDRNRRDVNLKRRQQLAVDGRADENAENSNPNLLTPASSVSRSKSVKEAIKSSADHKAKATDSPAPKLKSTLSAKNLLGRDIFSHIQEFCNELKKLTTRTREKAEESRESAKSGLICEEKKLEANADDDMDLDVDEVVRTRLLGTSKEKKPNSATNSKEKLRKLKRNGDLENIPLAIDLNIIKHGENQSLQKIRTNPPTPQCFSAARGQARATPTPTPTSSTKSRLKERGILQEMKLGSKGTPKKMQLQEGSKTKTAVPSVAEKEAKMMDVFWFLKPCTVSEASS